MIVVVEIYPKTPTQYEGPYIRHQTREPKFPGVQEDGLTFAEFAGKPFPRLFLR